MPDVTPRASTLIELLRLRAEEQPGALAFTFLTDGEAEAAQVTFGELDRRARSLAAMLAEQSPPGTRACLFFPPGLDYVAALFGCLYAGMIAVPAYPPRSRRRMPRLEALIEQPEGVVALTSPNILELLRPSLDTAPEPFRKLRWITGAPAPGSESAWSPPAAAPDSTAIIQYTSGSTASARGVMLSHRNLLHNLGQIQDRFGLSGQSRGVIWLPPYHDMGLIGGILEPVYAGFDCVLMSPAAFLQRPRRWLEAISRYRATISGGPNFAFDLSVRRIPPENRQGLDLSSWELAFNGAEPVRPETIERFVQAFAPCGFRRRAFRPCYGLAEATLMVSSGRVLAGTAVAGTTLVGCGPAIEATEISIVDPQSLEPLPPGHVGEIWVSGPSVAPGYFNRPQDTELVFAAERNGARYLRTGDLGYLRSGELFVTGRLKDLIVIRGANYYPHDVEAAVESSHPAFRRGSVAAFGVADADGERLVVAQELERQADVPLAEMAATARAAVAELHGLELDALLLLKAGTIPKTSSGKVRRGACRDAYLAGSLEAVAEWRPQTVAPSAPRTATAIQRWLADALSHRLGVPVADLDPRRPFTDYGLESADAVGLALELEAWLGRPAPPMLIWDFPSIDALSRHLAAAAPAENPAPASASAAAGSEPIAVIGLACRFPGADSPDAFWQLLSNGRSATTQVPAARWNSPPMAADGARWGGFLDTVDRFDPYFFGISPREAAHMDPQQRLLLETAWQAIEDAGQAAPALAGSPTGVFIGISSSDYAREQTRTPGSAHLDVYSGTGNALSIAANRISYTLDLKGPSLSVDTACSSSLVAVHLACQSLQRGESTLALAGGVNLMLSPETGMVFAQARMLAPNGQCKVFDAAADGYVRSEGCGVVVLKPLSDAVAAGDRIAGVILSSAVNQDGRTNGLTAPNGPSQQALVREALARAGVSARDIGYVETHGTGTPLGDPIEVQSLAETFVRTDEDEPTCWMGSVKANVGHLEPAAGVASLIKTLLALRQESIPPQIHVSRLNPHIALGRARLQIPLDPVPWPAGARRRLALVNSFGFGGTNAAVVVAEAPTLQRAPSTTPEAPEDAPGLHLFTLSGRTERARRELARRYADRLEAGRPPLADLCFSANTGRAHFAFRLAAIASSAEELSRWLRSFSLGGEPAEIALSTVEGAVRGEPVRPQPDRSRRSLEHLRNLYLEGFEIDWAAFHAGSTAARVALPTYPFERERFWIEAAPAAPQEAARLRPLLSRRLPCAEPMFEVELSTQAMPWLAAHALRGQPIFPAAGYLEMAIEAATEYFGEGSFELTGVAFEEALFFEGPEPRTVQLVLTPDAPAEARFRIFSRTPESDQWTLHSCGKVRPLPPPTPNPRPLPSGKEMDVGELYRRLDRSGLQYGEAFRGLKRAWPGAGEALGWVEIHCSLETVAGDFAIHPAFLDACLHVLAAADPSAGTHLPVAIDRFVWHGNFATRGWVHAALHPSSASLALWDESGQTVFEIEALRLEATEKRQPAAESPESPTLLHELLWEPADPAAPPEHLSGRWWIVPDRGGLADELSARIGNADGACEFLPENAAAVPANLTSVVSLIGLDAASADVLLSSESLVLQTVALVKKLTASPGPAPKLWLVTRGAQSAAPVQACLWGLGRVIALEYPQLRCTLVDLDADLDPDSPDTSALFAELAESGAESQVSLRRGQRLVARIAKLATAAEPAAMAIPPGESYFLSARALGNLDALILSPATRPAPAPGQVEVRVHAAGLNFSDVMKAMGRYPGATAANLVLGAEFAGVVERTGEGVAAFQPGDQVMGIAPHAFAPFASTDAALLVPKPANLRFEEAATVPVAFLTAAYSLHYLARLQKGETVLIHAGAGGVGLAAIQLAQRAGARVIATAGSPEKRAYLDSLGVSAVFDSRSLDFAAGVLAVTGGRGVDVVLNSLAGEAMARSLDLVAPHGRFVEIGKSDIYANRPLALTPFQRAISYFAVDLDRMFRERRELIHGLLLEIAGWLETGALRPLPLRLFPIQGAPEAFRHMAQARHIGKIVLSPAEPALAILRPDATYLITGGLGALGLLTASWMAGAGARHIVLAGRHAPSPEAQATVAALEHRGVEIAVKPADVGNLADLDRLLAETQTMPPLRGIVHAAGVLADATLANLNPADLRAVLQPKVAGAWLLHERTAGTPLDFFVLYSSLASVLGSPGQGSYAAANAFLDALAHHRRSLGLPALALNWGPWEGGGMAARAVFEGIHPLPPPRAFEQLEALLRSGRTGHAIAAAVDWRRLCERLGAPPLLAHVAGQPTEARDTSGPSLRDHLLSATAEERLVHIEDHILEEVGRVTGIPVARIDRSHSLGDLGIDSLTALELLTSLEQTLQVAVPMTIMMGGDVSVSTLAAHITARLTA